MKKEKYYMVMGNHINGKELENDKNMKKRQLNHDLSI